MRLMPRCYSPNREDLAANSFDTKLPINHGESHLGSAPRNSEVVWFVETRGAVAECSSADDVGVCRLKPEDHWLSFRSGYTSLLKVEERAQNEIFRK